MTKGKTVLAIIPARGGSKGVPGKNIRVVGGKPLLSRTIEAAQASQIIDRVILSSDDDEIIRVAEEYGCEVPLVRPAELATCEADPVDAVLHAIDYLNEKYNYIVLLQVTSPLRSTEDIDNCIRLCIDRGVPSVVSVTETEKSPYWMYRVNDSLDMEPLIQTDNRPQRRQDSEKIYELNGAVYVIQTDHLLENRSLISSKTLAYIMPKERSLDIDTELDIKILELLLDPSSSKNL